MQVGRSLPEYKWLMREPPISISCVLTVAKVARGYIRCFQVRQMLL
jgi:hypothetical protein